MVFYLELRKLSNFVSFQKYFNIMLLEWFSSVLFHVLVNISVVFLVVYPIRIKLEIVYGQDL